MSFGIILNGNNNIIIRNCKLSDWSHPLNLLNGENISVENVEAFSGVWIGPFVANSNNVYLSNITVHDFAQDGFTFRTNNSRLENATIYNVGHIGISIDTNSNNISLENIEVFNTSDIGISIDGSNHVLRNLTVHDTGHYGVILNGNSNYVNNTKIYYVNAEYPNEGGIVISCNDCLIENSEIFNTTAIEKNGRGIFSQHSNNLTIRNSKIYNIGWEACTSLEEADNITLDNVEAWNCWSLRFSYATNSRIINSRTQWVVVDSSSSNILISNNTLEDGIGMDSSSNILISNNTIKGSLGMAMGNSDKITITNNTFENDVLSYYYNIVSDVLSCNNTATFNRSYDFEDGTVLLNVMRTESDSCTPYISYTAPTQISFGSVIPYNTYVNDTEETTISSNMVNMTFSLNGTSDFVSNGYNFSISYLNFSADKNFPYPVEETTVELNTIKNTFLFLVNQTNSIIYNLWRLKVPKTYAGDYTANVTLMVST
jgi:parallel beta-helix repeat protein